MSRPLHIWLVFAVCLAVVLAAMGWISLTVLELDSAQAEARREAANEENIRLALWRMDCAIAGIVASENARPYFAYSSFYSAERAYNRMFEQLERGEVLIPSPLLKETSQYVLLHFQLAPDGTLSSPQVPQGNMLDLAEAYYTTQANIETFAARLSTLEKRIKPATLASLLKDSTPVSVEPVRPTRLAQLPAPRDSQLSQELISKNEMQARNLGQRAVVDNTQAINYPAPSSGVVQGPMVPLWLGSNLIMARSVQTDSGSYIQGCWLDWEAIKGWFLSSISDLLPESDLVPVLPGTDPKRTRMLAGLPVRLEPGSIPDSPGPASPLRISLLIAWICIAVGAAAVAVLLSGTLSLSERRWAFVSAVTHELRTPLTTFRMYAEMLAEGMVPEEEKRKRYLQRLCTEADRLAHLVENVLAYARLERGSVRHRLQETPVAAMLERLESRLSDRAEQAGMELIASSDSAAAASRVLVDSTAVEQILFNLVDNACKYASSASDKRIHLESQSQNGRVLVKVRDHGPGVSEADSNLLFRPFRKSAKDAAYSAPGVGLGLALSLRLARQMDARLYLDSGIADGACFVLSLPTVA